MDNFESKFAFGKKYFEIISQFLSLPSLRLNAINEQIHLMRSFALRSSLHLSPSLSIYLSLSLSLYLSHIYDDALRDLRSELQ